MKLATAIVLGAAGMAAIAGTARGQVAQQVGTARTELQRRDLSIPGREAIQVRVELAPGTLAPAHSHPGEELIYVLEGTFEYDVAGKRMTLTAGQTLFIPAGTVHAARNVGSGTASEIATYIVDKRKPLVTLAK